MIKRNIKIPCNAALASSIGTCGGHESSQIEMCVSELSFPHQHSHHHNDQHQESQLIVMVMPAPGPGKSASCLYRLHQPHHCHCCRHQHYHHNMQLLWFEPFCMQQRLHQTHHSNVGIYPAIMCAHRGVRTDGRRDK